jgi:hypothetical protein
MFMRFICCLFFMTLCYTSYEQTNAAAQTNAFDYKRDFKTILEKTQEKGSEMSYQKLLIRFLDRDTTLSDMQVLYLLIGYTEDNKYKPFEDMNTEQEIFDLNDAGSYEEALIKGKPFLQTHPVSLRALKEVSYAYHSLSKKDSAEYYMDLAVKIINAMIYSGNGKKPEQPIFSLGLADGESFIPSIGLKILSKDTDWNRNNQFMEIIDASQNTDDHVNYFFVIEHAKQKIDDDKVNDAGDKKSKNGDKKGKWDKKEKKKEKGKPVEAPGAAPAPVL